VVAEMPGISKEDVHITVEDDLLTFSAERGDKKYRKEVLLPASCAKEKIAVACNNGVVEIKCKKCKK
jgi:HSP20 family protein